MAGRITIKLPGKSCLIRQDFKAMWALGKQNAGTKTLLNTTVLMVLNMYHNCKILMHYKNSQH